MFLTQSVPVTTSVRVHLASLAGNANTRHKEVSVCQELRKEMVN